MLDDLWPANKGGFFFQLALVIRTSRCFFVNTYYYHKYRPGRPTDE